MKKTKVLKTRDQVINVLKGGRMASVTFIKADGSVRTINGQFGNKSRLKGGPKPFKDGEHNVVTVCEFGAGSGNNAGRHKSFRVDRVIYVKANGQLYKGCRYNEVNKVV